MPGYLDGLRVAMGIALMAAAAFNLMYSIEAG